jgi:hypothetical protein
MTQRLRYEIIKRDNSTCRYCGAKAPEVKLTVDHVVPKALGGTDEPSNLVAACQPCNAGKSSVSPSDEVVARVADDALRFARALELVTAQRRQAVRDIAEHIEWFDAAWTAWTYADRNTGERKTINRDDGWQASIEQFFSRGLDRDDITHAMRRAMTNQVAKFRWRLFCRYAWDEINERLEVAKASFSRPPAEVEEVEDEDESPVFGRGYDAGWHDGSANERYSINSEIEDAYERGFREGVARIQSAASDYVDISDVDPSDWAE